MTHSLQRRVTLILLSILTFIPVLVLAALSAAGATTINMASTSAGALFCGVLLFLYWRGWEPSRYLAVIFVTLITGLTTQEPFLTHQPTLAIFIPVTAALIMTPSPWVVGSIVTTYVLLLVRGGPQSPYADPVNILLVLIIVGGIVLARWLADKTQHALAEHARHAEEERDRAERQSRELVLANERMAAQIEQQSQLLDLVATLETPAVTLAEGVLFAPIVGHVDSRRAQLLTTRLLTSAGDQRARMVILDIAGVTVMDSSVAEALLNTARALRLLGCQVTISGISAAVAVSLIQLGIDLNEVRTARSPQEALGHYLDASLGKPHGNGNGLAAHN